MTEKNYKYEVPVFFTGALYFFEDGFMKKFSLVFLMSAAFIMSAVSEIVPPKFSLCFNYKKFDVLVYTYPQAKDLENEEIGGQEDVTSLYGQVFEDDRGNKCELRYSFFVDNKPEEELTEETALSVMMQSAYIWFMNAFDGIPKMEFWNEIKPEYIQEDFNGDYCWTITLPAYSERSFGKGYSIDVIHMLYKKGQGFVIRSFLYPENYNFGEDMEYGYHNLITFKFFDNLVDKTVNGVKY